MRKARLFLLPLLRKGFTRTIYRATMKEELTPQQKEYLAKRFTWASPKNYERLAKYLKISL